MAPSLSQRLWEDSHEGAVACLFHPFVRALAAGTLPRCAAWRSGACLSVSHGAGCMCIVRRTVCSDCLNCLERREERGQCVCCRKAFQQYVAQDEFFLSAFSHAFERAIVRAAGDHGIQSKLRELLEGVRKELLLHEAFAKVRFEICCVEVSLAGLIAAILFMSRCACRKGASTWQPSVYLQQIAQLTWTSCNQLQTKRYPMHTAITVVSGICLHHILQFTLCQILG